MVTNGLPRPLVNENVFFASGRFLARADLYVKDYGELHVTRVNAEDLRHET